VNWKKSYNEYLKEAESILKTTNTDITEENIAAAAFGLLENEYKILQNELEIRKDEVQSQEKKCQEALNLQKNQHNQSIFYIVTFFQERAARNSQR